MTGLDDTAIWQGGSGNINIAAGTLNVGSGRSEPPKGKAMTCSACGQSNWLHAEACASCGLDFHPRRKLAWRAALLLALAAPSVVVTTRFLL